MLKTSLEYIRNMFWYIWDTFGKIETFRFLDVYSPDGQTDADGRIDDSDKTWTDVQNPLKRP